MLYLPKRPIAKAFANASWQQQHREIENILTLRKEGWRGVDLQPHFDAVTKVENVAIKCLKKGDWLLDHIEEELAFMRGADFHRPFFLRRDTFKLDKRYRFFRNVWNNVHLQEQKFGLIFLGTCYQQTANLEDSG